MNKPKRLRESRPHDIISRLEEIVLMLSRRTRRPYLQLPVELQHDYG